MLISNKMLDDDKVYKHIIGLQARNETVDESRRYGVHFDYHDLCSRLLKIADKKTVKLHTLSNRRSESTKRLRMRNNLALPDVESKYHSNVGPKSTNRKLLRGYSNSNLHQGATTGHRGKRGKTSRYIISNVRPRAMLRSVSTKRNLKSLSDQRVFNVYITNNKDSHNFTGLVAKNTHKRIVL